MLIIWRFIISHSLYMLIMISKSHVFRDPGTSDGLEHQESDRVRAADLSEKVRTVVLAFRSPVTVIHSAGKYSKSFSFKMF